MWAPQTSANCRPAAAPKRLSTRDAKAWVFLPSAASAACARSGARAIRARIMSATRTECWATRDCRRIPATAPLSCTAADFAVGMSIESPVEGDSDAEAEGDAAAEPGVPVAAALPGDDDPEQADAMTSPERNRTTPPTRRARTRILDLI